ncbi:MAG: eukaryotic-like serine/threonine-protein kinase, partial [Solirubrobacteraceae bacterium]|nr:eukaryotic-like serine/threonine-protein kinase [Solirubrobacteraceae bacterium]
VHRDLKPENLMVTSDGRVKIADFGIAKATNQMQTGAFLTATGTTVGTPTYMAPEQAMAQDIGPSTDLYSVGCMAFEMFTGRVPFHDTEAPMAILLRHVNEQIPSVKSIDPKIDQEISDWIDRMLVKDPTKRTQNANDAWDEFEEIIIGLLGPRWRREARLREGSAQFDTPAPLTPAPFKGTTSDAAVSDQFQSFAWGNAVTPDAPAPPGPDTPPPSDSAPLPPEPTVGPPTPAPGPAVGSDGAAPDSDGGGFVTFGAPAAPEASEVAQDDPPAVAAEAPAVEESAAPTEPLTEPQEDGGFETYIAPAPLRPPTDDAPPEAPAIPDPAPDPEPVAAAPPPPAPAPTPPPAPAPAPIPLRPLDEEDDLAKTVMPASVKPPAAAPAQPRETEKPAAAVKEPKPPKQPKEKSGGKGVLIGIGVAAVLAAVIGFVVGGSGGKSDGSGSTPTAAASNADLEALFPKGWTKASAPQIPGMTLASPVAMKPPAAKGGQSVVLGQVKRGANNPTLLPAGLLAALGLGAGEVPPREPVQLKRSQLQAYRYKNLRPRGLNDAVTLFTVPTSAGIATLACVDPGVDCEGIADTLKLNAGTAFPVGPSKEYAAALGKTLGGLDKKVSSGRAALQGAKTPKAQAAAAGGLAAAYGAAAKETARLKVSPADQATNTLLAASLARTGAAYGKLAAAARSSSKSGYAKARTAVQRSEQSVAGALRALQAAGYKIAQ